VRAIADGAQIDVPVDFNRVIDDYGRIARFPAVLEVMSHPSCIPRFAGFAIASAQARRSLARFLDRYVDLLSGGGNTGWSAARAEVR
jgi:hypothetical protein